MPEPPLSPSQQVERIREILVGRQMQQVEERLERLEKLLASHHPSPDPPVSSSEQIKVTEEFWQQMKQEASERDRQIHDLTQTLAEIGQRLDTLSSQAQHHDQVLSQHLRVHLEGMASTLAARVDARVREILHHLQSELSQLRQKTQDDLQLFQQQKADRAELQSRFARLASAAMEKDPLLEPREGFLP